MPGSVDQELGEVPGDSSGRAPLTFQPDIEGIGILSVHFDLRELGERRVVVERAEGVDVLGAAGGLPGELVAGEVEYREAAVPVPLIQRLESFVLGGESASCRGVDHEKNLAPPLVQLPLPAVTSSDDKVVYVRRIRWPSARVPDGPLSVAFTVHVMSLRCSLCLPARRVFSGSAGSFHAMLARAAACPRCCRCLHYVSAVAYAPCAENTWTARLQPADP